MGSGTRLAPRQRYLLRKLFIVRRLCVDDVFDLLYDSDPGLIKRKYLVDRRRFFLTNSTTASERARTASYIAGAAERVGGRPRIIGHADARLIETIISEHSDWTDKRIAKFFSECLVGHDEHASVETVRRSRLRSKLVDKAYTRVHGT